MACGPHSCHHRRPSIRCLDAGQQAELLAEVDRVELGKLGPLADRIVAEAYGRGATVLTDEVQGRARLHHLARALVTEGREQGLSMHELTQLVEGL